MRESHQLEQAVGIRYYVSPSDGVGGYLRDEPSDFRVREQEAFAAAIQPVDADTGSYPHLLFRATLHGWDTNDFASALSSKLGISRERVSWAGTKDKHAITTQLFSVDLPSNDLPSLPETSIEIVGRAGRPVLFGDLRGNEFELRVRDADRPAQTAAITADLQAFTADTSPSTESIATDEIAVPNFFGQQRFGSKRHITHRVGLDILNGDWETAAIRYICHTSDREPPATRQARTTIDEHRDWADAIDILPSQLQYERAIAARLADSDSSPQDFRAALEQLPSNLQRLFVHAAQSYLFNRILSERLTRGLPFGRPVPGDVVCFADDTGLPTPDRSQPVDADRVDTVARHCDRGRAFVTAPLIGTDTEFGHGEPREILQAVLADAGIQPPDFDLPGEFNSTGTQRAIRATTAIEIQDDPMVLTFTLPKGSYATIVAREYLKQPPDALH